ncbi:uncharacterized protein LOC130892920 [Diorhabda carinulata]|uniref:uncharacterized protein LOC130892920 n=1 Tax=Diorhabda carinulata TaxID=1163345 RepID=UPI0025A0F82A|nr:uncharacterized protein LOC130892920 [Diorhabda carinulata]
MANLLDENFFYNSMLAKAMVTLLPPNDRKIMRIWFDKMLELDKTDKEKSIRNEYMWFMLLMLQVRKIREPFNKLPPNEIGDLRDLVPTKVYEEVLIANDDNMELDEKSDEKKVSFQLSAPTNFLANQPVPCEGIICYFSAFSDRGT